MPYKDPEAEKRYQREYAKKWRLKHAQQYRKRVRAWVEANREKVRQYSRKYYWANREKEILRVMRGAPKYHCQRKMDALITYGGNPPKCACCGEMRIPFLTIDHINGKTAEHRAELKRFGSIYQWLKSMNYPSGFRVLCMNCNFAIGKFGSCPHQEEGISALESETSQ